MNEITTVRPMIRDDIDVIVEAFDKSNWTKKPRQLFETYLDEMSEGRRLVWVALSSVKFAGYVTLNWHSSYPPFQRTNVPEIADLNVLPSFRRRGIGSALLDAAEKAAFSQSASIGIGFGLYLDYGSAQRLYIKRGYLPDGQGITYQYAQVIPPENVPVDDDLVLWLTKERGTIKEEALNHDDYAVHECRGETEWAFAKKCRQTYFFDKVPVNDPYTWTFEDVSHRHFVLCVNGEMVGYAHVQLWPDRRAALRIIVIVADFRGKGYGEYFMRQLENKLSHEGIVSLHAESNPEALGFYGKLGYISMPFDDPEGHESCDKDTPIGKRL